MIKNIFMVLVIMILYTNAKAQTRLYHGIRSGMTQTEFMDYVNNSECFEWSIHGELFTYVNDRRYFVNYKKNFNKNGNLIGIRLISANDYEWDNNAKHVLPSLKSVYGEPVHDHTVDGKPNVGNGVILYKFEKGNIVTGIIRGDRNGYHIIIPIFDITYRDSNVVKETKGF